MGIAIAILEQLRKSGANFLVTTHYPDKKIGIVCETVNEKGVLRVQIADRKIEKPDMK